MRLRFLPDAVVLEVEDDGIGFQGGERDPGMGLISMRERAELVNGRIEFLRRAARRSAGPADRPVAAGGGRMPER